MRLLLPTLATTRWVSPDHELRLHDPADSGANVRFTPKSRHGPARTRFERGRLARAPSQATKSQ
jgi:hypothetical protein